MEINANFIMENGFVTEYQGTEKHVVVPAGVVGIGSSAFFGNKDLVSVTLPSGLREIEASAFSECKALEEINLPDSVQVIGDEAFMLCSNLKHIRIPSGAQVYESAFWGCEKVQIEADDGFAFLTMDQALEGMQKEGII